MKVLNDCISSHISLRGVKLPSAYAYISELIHIKFNPVEKEKEKENDKEKEKEKEKSKVYKNRKRQGSYDMKLFIINSFTFYKKNFYISIEKSLLYRTITLRIVFAYIQSRFGYDSNVTLLILKYCIGNGVGIYEILQYSKKLLGILGHGK